MDGEARGPQLPAPATPGLSCVKEKNGVGPMSLCGLSCPLKMPLGTRLGWEGLG